MKTLADYVTHAFSKWNLYALTTAIALGMAMCSSSALAQSGAGSIQGTVSDSTGAVIPGASIHVVNQATGVAADSKSNGVGFYQVPGLFAGSYTLTVTAPNMKTYKAGIELLVDQNAVVNPAMSAGAVTQQVEVSGDIVQLTTTDNGTIDSNLENARINQLPMNGRELFTLVEVTTPGIERGEAGLTGNVNGVFSESMENIADGAPMLNRNFGGVLNSDLAQLPDPDSVQEVKIATSNPSAQFATPAAMVITTKSGTNSLHGSFFETARNNAFGIAKARSDPFNLVAPHLVRNEFGASAGGPIILPKVYHGKNKSFWFFAYERYSLAQTASKLAKVPTNAMKQGDFSGLYNSSAVLQQLYDPATTAPSSNCNGSGTANQYCRARFPTINGLPNQMPINRLANVTKVLWDITPPATSADNPLVTNNFTAENPSFTVVPTITFRLDHNFNENNRAYLRFQDNLEVGSSVRADPVSIAADGIPAGASGLTGTVIGTFGGSIGYTHVFSPTFFAESIVSQEWFDQNFTGGFPSGGVNLDYEQMLGLPNNFGATGFPDIDTGGFANLFGTQYNYSESSIISNIDENLTKVVGRHQMQFGGRYRHERFGYLPDRSQDTVAFVGEATALENPASGSTYGATSNTGNDDADYFLGAAGSYGIHLNSPYIHFHDMELDAYFQDNYHVSRNFTVNIGLRYEAHPAGWMKDGLVDGFDLKNDALILDNPPSYYEKLGYSTQAIFTNLTDIGAKIETPAEAGFPSTIMKNYDFTFGPRVGLAYQPFGGKHGTVIRGAYGRYIYPIPTRNAFLNPVRSNPPFYAAYSESYTAANQSPDGLGNYLLRAPQTVVMGVNSSNVVDTSTTTSILPGSQALVSLDKDYAPDMVTETNATIEQALKGTSALRVSWVWTHGANLDHYYQYNLHPSSYVWEMQTGTIPPTGSVIGSNQYSATATGPYDQTTWGGNTMDVKNGWSNYNALQVSYQRLFHHGIAYQITYVWDKALRVGGNWSRDSVVAPTADYAGNSGTIGTMTPAYGTVLTPALPPAQPQGIAPYAEWHALDVFEEYKVDSKRSKFPS